MPNPGRAARKRGATEVDSTGTSTFRPGQVVAAEASAFGNFDGVVEQGTVQKADETSVEHRQVGKRAKTRAPSKEEEEEDAEEESEEAEVDERSDSGQNL